MIIDQETGEIIHKRVAAYTKRMTRGWDMVRKYGFLTLKERDTVEALSCHLNYQNQIVDGGVPMSPSMMARAIYEDPRNFHKVLKSLQRKNVVGCWKSNEVEVWYINPALFRKGSNKKDIASVFSSTAKMRTREGAKLFNITHENYYSSMTWPADQHSK